MAEEGGGECKIRIVLVCFVEASLEVMLKKQRLESVCHLGPRLFLRVGAPTPPLCQAVSPCLLAGKAARFSPLAKCFGRDMKERDLVSTRADRRLP